MKRQSVVTIVILAMILTFTVGYALLSETVEVSGTATATGTMDVEFTTGSITSVAGCINASVTISNDKNAATITVPRLEYPGAYAVATLTVTNVGTLPVKITQIRTANFGTNSNGSGINVSTNASDYQSVTLNPNGTQTITVTVEWPSDYVPDDWVVDGSSLSTNFWMYIDYVQDS